MLTDTLFFSAVALILGFAVGSFLNVVIYRLPIMMERNWQTEARMALQLPAENSTRFNLCVPPSACPHCQHKIRWWQNIPLLSYLLLRGRCAACAVPISPRYFCVELLTGLVFAAVVWRYDVTPVAAGGLILTAALIALTFIDADTQLLPDQITLPLLWLGLLFNWYCEFVPLSAAVWGAALGYLSLWSLFWLFKLLTGKDGMGYGDFKLLAALGAWMGAAALPLIVFMAAIVGIIASVILKVARSQPMAFGPALTIAGWIVWMANSQINQLIHWWLRLSGFGA
ncbi:MULTISPECIES: prepilin peptidase [Snodgrassella]|uniref:prepilin peptidase n=1 Tax=Snodgrassella TaxID=1193515 RepID=UPI0008155636|nr:MULTISPECIES: A24 family peptidase [Snodgrassella]SCC06024.1 leader peptidase (prepilin peptidase) / N-methyltransferase [Snodgrassella sp. R-53583]